MHQKYKTIIFSSIFCIHFSCNTNTEKEKHNKNDIEIYNEISKSYHLKDAKCELLDSKKVLSYDILDAIQSRQKNFNLYFKNSDTAYKNLIENLVISNKQGNNLMAYAKCSNDNKTLLYTMPIYDKLNKKAVVCVQFICGTNCAETNLLLIELNKDKWDILDTENLAVE